MPTPKDLLKQRQSIRKYTSQPVPDKLILEALEAASWAPSAHNAQPWRFIVISDITVKHRLVTAMAEAWVNNQSKDNLRVNPVDVDFSVKRFSTAPIVIVACLSLKDTKKYLDDTRQQIERDLAIQSLGAAIQNLLLSASGNSLGACWFSAPMFCKEAVRPILQIPETVEPQAIILMGYPDQKPPERQRNSLNAFCFQNYWNNPFSP